METKNNVDQILHPGLLSVSDYYEWSMAQSNMDEGYFGLQAVFDFMFRSLPKTKVVGSFYHEGIKYDKMSNRAFMVNAGLEQVAATLLDCTVSETLLSYFRNVMAIGNDAFLDWAASLKFKGDLYAIPEGRLVFGNEPQLRIHERFEVAQVFESLLCSMINPQTNVATTANDISMVVSEHPRHDGSKKILLEGGSRRGTSPQSSLYNSRAAIIGGLDFSSNVAYGIAYGKKVGGTHGHSYVMLHPDEYSAFKAQADFFKDDVCFLLDTYDYDAALETAIEIVEKEGLSHFSVRIDSGDLCAQSKKIVSRLTQEGYSRDRYTIVASDDLTAGKIKHIEENGGQIDTYLVGTFLVYPPKPVPGVYKMCAYCSPDGLWHETNKFSESKGKSTLPGIKQVYRITGIDGMYSRDLIALVDESIDNYLFDGETAEPLLTKVIDKGRLVYDFPSPDEISRIREQELSKLPAKYKRFEDPQIYPVVLSDGLIRLKEHMRGEKICMKN